MGQLGALLARQPLVPYIRESDFAVRRPWKMPARRLLDYLLLYIQEGECRIEADGTEYVCTGGEFCLIQPGSLLLLEGVTSTITPFAHLDLFYNPLREQSFPTRAGQVDLTEYKELMQPRLNDLEDVRVPVRFTPAQPVRFRDTMLRMIASWQRSDPLSRLEAQHDATELILTVLREHGGQEKQAASAEPTLNWITSYFSFNLSEPLSVEQMAGRAHLSPSRFSAVFKERFGVPPHKYLLQLRIQHAGELLKTTGLGLQDIAAYCGFADIHHFSKAFKRSTGLSPGAYREAQRTRD